MPSSNSRMLSTVLSCLIVTACGGGGGGDAPSSPPPAPASAADSAEGFWTGTASSGYSLLGAVLDNGEYWVMYHANGFLYGVVQGVGRSNGGSFSSSSGLDYFLGGGVTPVAVSASYRSRTSLQGTVTPQSGGAPITFTAGYDSAYDTPASISAVQGTWRGRLTSGESYAINVAPGGALSGAGSSGCTFTGRISPRASGKAVYDVAVTFNGGVCLLGTQTIRGIGVVAGTAQQPALFTAALNATRSAGFVLIAGR